MFGMGYVINHCISHFQKEEEQLQIQEFQAKTLSYIAQGIEYISHNTAYIPYLPYFKAGEGKVLMKYSEFIEDKPKDERTAEEVVEDVFKNCGF